MKKLILFLLLLAPLCVSAQTVTDLSDPGSNGVVKRTALGITGPAASSDLIALWTGTCNNTTFLRADGACATAGAVSSVFGRTGAVVAVANDYTFDLIGAGSNLNTLSLGNAGNLKPVNLGQIAGNQAWLQPGISAFIQGQFSAVNSGGNIGAGHTMQTQYTLNSALGETLPNTSFGPNVSAAGCTIGSCTLTIAAPTIPSGYIGWTMYFCDTSGGGGCTVPVKVLACANISTSCVITNAALNSGTLPPTTNTAIVTPPNVQATNGAGGFLPAVFFPKTDGNYYPWLGVEWNSCDAANGPPLPCGTPMFTHRTWFSDLGNAPYNNQTVGGKNAFVVIDHGAGVGTVTTNQDRALWVNWQNPTNDATARYSGEVIQAELDFNCNGCSVNGSPDGEVTAISAQLTTAGASTNWTVNGYATNAVQGRVFRNGAGFDSTGINAVYGNVSNANTTASAGSVLAGLRSKFDGTANASNIRGVGLRIDGPGTTGRFGLNDGIFSQAGFTPAAGLGSADNFIDQRTHNWNSLLNGAVGLSSIENTDGGTTALAVNASLNDTGSLTVNQITSAWAGISSTTCSGGASTYSYQLVANDGNGGQSVSVSGASSGASCANPLTAPNPATIGFTAASSSASFRQAKTIDIYRISGPMATGKIGTLTCNFNLPINGCASFSDTGLAAGAALPTGNTTGGATIGGDFTLGISKGQHINTQAANSDTAGTCTLGTNCVVTFTRAYTAAPVCVATDTTAAAAVRVVTTTGGATFTGTGTDVLAYICTGNPN